jgi:multidrug efflux pump subunit AcrA (membrane-fusion protein)
MARDMPGQTYDELVKAPRVALVLGVAGVALALTACSGDEAPIIETGEVGTATVVEVVEAPASVVAAASAGVSAPATGTVASIRVRDGQRVGKGDVLLVVDSPEAERNLAAAQQAAASVPAGVSLSGVDPAATNVQASQAAQRAFDQARDAARQIPDRQLRKQALQQVAAARAQFVAAQTQANATVAQINQGIASLEQALGSLTQAQQAQGQAAVAAAQRTVDALTVRAPIRGTVVLGPSAGESGGSDVSGLVDQLPDSLAGQAESLLGGEGETGGSTTGELQVGSPVSAGDPLLSITDVSSLSLRAEVDETDVLLVRKNIKADVELDAVPGSSYRAVVRNVGLSPTTSSRGGVSYVVRLQLLGGTTVEGSPAPRPLPGMSAVAALRVATEKDAVSVPVSAVFRDGERDAVWFVEGGIAQKRTVVIGAQGEDFLQVTEGLEVGDLVVTRGADQVSEGDEVP